MSAKLELLAQRMERTLQTGRIVVLAVVLALAGPLAASAADVLLDLGTLGGFSSVPGGIDPTGRVVGGSATSALGSVRAFIWAPDPIPNGSMVSIGTLGGNAYATAINADGVVVGYSPVTGFLDKAFRWTQGGGMVSLGTLPGGAISSAFGINDAGQIVGESTVAGGAFRAFLLNPGEAMQNLGTLPGGGWSWARAINQYGHVVGSAVHSDGGTRAFLWTPALAAMQDLGVLEGAASSNAYGINAGGRVVGWSTFAGAVDRAVIWESNGDIRALAMPPGGAESRAYGIDDGGRIVGEVVLSNGSQLAVLWDATGTPRTLGLLPGGNSSIALRINAAGQIVGQATNAGGYDHAVRWQLNVPPTSADQGVTTSQDTPVAFNVSASDADADLLSYSLVSGPSHGTLSGNLPNVTYTPAAGFFGPDSFTFKVNDGTEDSNVATVSITVTKANQAPTASDLSVSTPQDTPVALTVTGGDPDGDAVSFVLITGPAHGSLAGGLPTPTYTPAPGYTGGDSFTFRVNDGTADSNVATVAIAVTAVTPPAETLDGRMGGDGSVRVAGQQHEFAFQVRSGPAGTIGNLAYARGTDRFESTGLTRVAFSDASGLAPGSHAIVDTVVFAGLGNWNGQPGHGFEVRATDAGEPGVGHDGFAVTITSPSGAVVVSVSDLLASGNIQSNRVQNATATSAALKRKR